MKFLLPAVLLIVSFSGNAFAGFCFRVEPADGSFVYFERGDGPCFLKKQFAASGMYLNDGSTSPLWTTDAAGKYWFPGDMHHLVVFPDFGHEPVDNRVAIAFYDDGKLIRDYKVGDLITFPFLSPGPSHGGNRLTEANGVPPATDTTEMFLVADEGVKYANNDGATFDRSRQLLSFTSRQGDKFVFNYANGELVSSERPARSLALRLGAMWLGVLALIFVLTWRHERWHGVAALYSGLWLIVGILIVPILSVAFYDVVWRPAEREDFLWTFSWMVSFTTDALPRYFFIKLGLMTPATHFSQVGEDTWYLSVAAFWLPSWLVSSLISKFLLKLLKSSFGGTREVNRIEPE